MEPQPRIGVYICHCGTNIAANVDVEQVAGFAATLPGVVVARDYLYMCSDPGQALIQQDIEEQGLNKVVVASCSPRMHEPTFRAAAQQTGLNPYLVEMANIREQCSWVHTDREGATEKAKLLVASVVAKAALLEPLEEREVEVTPGAVVIGGGVAGIIAALDVAGAGFPVYLVEKSDHLGGRVADLNCTFPTLEPVVELLEPLVERVQSHPNVTVFLKTQVASVEGYVGNFEVEVSGGGGAEERGSGRETLPNKGGGESIRNRQIGPSYAQAPIGKSTNLDASRDARAPALRVGSIIVATGYDVFDPHRKPELGYGQYPNVITSLEMERRLAAGDLTGFPKPVRSVAFIQCVGSRDVQLGNPYCSRVCCMYTAKQSRLVRELLPEADVTVFFMDVRTFGKGAEEFYDEVRAKGVLYRRGNVSEIYRRGDRVVLVGEDTLLGQPFDFEVDLVVLAVGMEPRSDVGDLSTLLKLPRSADGFFLELHPKLRPVDTAVDGVFLAGCCQGPKDITDTVAQAKAAASSALIPLLRGTVPVESATAVVDEEWCAGCGMCVEVCPYGAPALDPFWGVSRINAVLCKGCGACAVACPSKAIRLQHFTPEQIMAQVDALVG
ncbi:MAG: CoB--CoM heterodisulfide reductase iron-sulfur subunit A family protein [Anaerolineae bacterium]|nr:CoB--CoM heterodisulfide reductase iron-sulfur subunit A family protein [Anaerolineae bacterium]